MCACVCVVKHSHSVVAVAKKRASRVSPQKQHVCGTTGKDLFTSNRIASQTIATFRWPRWREVHEKFTRLFHFSGPFPGNVLPSLHITIPKPRRQRFADGTFKIPNGTQTTTSIRPPTNDRTCMGWHTRHASIRSRLEGHLRPETLNLTAWNHALGLNKTQERECECVGRECV